MFSSEPNVLLYLSRAVLRVYNKKGESAKLALPVEAVQYLQVFDGRKLDEVLQQFVVEQKLHGSKICMLLDASLLFEKTIPASKDTEAHLAEFESKLPFETDERQIVTAPTENQSAFHVFGTNKKLYEAVLKPFMQADCKIIAVMPATAFNIKQNAELSVDTVTTLLRTTKRYRRVQFVTN